MARHQGDASSGTERNCSAFVRVCLGWISKRHTVVDMGARGQSRCLLSRGCVGERNGGEHTEPECVS